MQERRVYPRLVINHSAGFFSGACSRPIPCIVEDISLGGARICFRRKIFPEVLSHLNLTLLDSFSLNVQANVVWQDESETKNTYGLSFTQIDEREKEKLATFIQGEFKIKSESGSYWSKDL